MIAPAKWYLLVTLVGWLAWPLAFRHLRHLPDRGYLVSRAVGLLLVGYTFWILASLGLVANTPGAMLLALLLVAVVGAWQYQTRPNSGESLLGWLRDNRSLVILAEALFLLAFVGWTVVRAHDPALNTTEKPMELTFLNGIRQSQIFPPRDPWLAGYAISYYYFGYVMVAMLADLTALESAVAFNVAIPMLFALTLLGAYAVVYNLVNLGRREEDREKPDIFWPLLGPLFVGIMGNLAGALELLRALRLPASDAFWAWLDVQDLSAPLQAEILWPLEKWRFWWWWRASRVIHDRDLTGATIGLQPIDEFPLFSFLLGDMHPHVLALPFTLLAIGLALNLAAGRPREKRPLGSYGFIFYALAVGALAFLNTWDLPIYLFVVAGAEALRVVRVEGRLPVDAWLRVVGFGLSLLLLALALYLPFYVGFRSQLSGVLPNVLFPTRLPNFLVMFGTLLFVVLWFVVRQAARWHGAGERPNWRLGVPLAVGLLLLLIGLMALAGMLALREEMAQDFLLSSAGFEPAALPLDAAPRREALSEAIRMAVARRLEQSGVALLLTALLAVCFSLFFRRRENDAPGQKSLAFQPPDFAILLVGTGALLALGPEFLYLRDIFGQRINTVFKFYYAGWALFGIAAAYAAWELATSPRTSRAVRGLFVALGGLLVVGGLVYPVFAIPSKANFEADPTLDGIAYIAERSPGDLDAIRWLQANADPDAIVLEAVGGQYSYYARVSATTGLPTLLGWSGHELQWRGSLEAAGSRETDVKTIYSTPDIRTAQQLLDHYGVTYVFVGSLEREYGTRAGLEKFERFLTPAYHNGEVTIYRADQPLVLETQ